MKKIVLFAAASLAVSSAFAAAPAKKLALDKYESQRVSVARELCSPMRDRAEARKAVSIKELAMPTTSRADEEGVSDVKALYGPSQASFYLGITPNGSFYRLQAGFTGIRNLILFPNISTGAVSSEWSYGYVTGVENNEYVYDMQTSTEERLAMPLKPESVIKTPELTVKGANGATDTYEADIYQYYAGLSPDLWIKKAHAEDVHDRLGASLYSYISTQPTIMDEFCVNRAPAEDEKDYFESTGVSVSWTKYLTETYKGTDFKKITPKGFGSMVSAKPSPYILENMWSYFLMTCTEDVVLTSKVYVVSSEEGVDYNKPIGKAELSFSAGSYPTEDGDLMGIFSYEALDEDGYETDMPLVIDGFTPIFVTIEGLENPAITEFMCALGSESVLPLAEAANQSALYPYHALAILDIEFSDKGSDEVQNMIYEDAAPWPYYTDKTRQKIFFGTDMWMYFDVFFPTIYNLDEDSKDYETAEFSAQVPTEGGAAEFNLFASYDIEALVENEIMTVESSDWLSYEFVPDTEDYTIKVTAEALPSDLKGRRGVVSFKGFACDFDLYVTQGDVSGISNVAATTGKVELFDLQGRKLNAAPANGIYLERNGNVTTKRIARN